MNQVLEPHRPNPDHAHALQSIENQLNQTLQEKHSSSTVNLEAHLLLSKLHYAIAQFDNVCFNFLRSFLCFQALKDVDSSGMDLASTQFRTLRSFRLVAEAYAIKGK